MLAPEVTVVPLTGVALLLLAVAALTGWLDGPLRRIRLGPRATVMACAALLAAPGHRWWLSLRPLAPWLAVGVRPALPLDPGAFLLPLLLAWALALREGRRQRRRALLAAVLVGRSLLACFLWLPGEPGQSPLLDPALLYAFAGGLAACLLACSPAGAAAGAATGYAVAEAGRALAALWLGTPVLVLGGDPSRPLLLAALVAVGAGELVYEARLTTAPAATLPRRRHRLPPRP